MQEILKTLQSLENTPLPNLMILAGFLFLLLAFVGRIGAIIELPQERQKWSGIIGAVLIILGLGLFILPRFQSDSIPNDIDVIAGEPTISPIIRTITPQASSLKSVLYDDFNDPTFDGLYNQLLWQPTSDMCQFVQQDGILKLEHSGTYRDDCELGTQRYNNFPLESKSIFETMLMLDTQGNEGLVSFRLAGTTWSGARWTTRCAIRSASSDNTFGACYYQSPPVDEPDYQYSTKSIPIESKTWHKFLIEIEPDEKITYYIDDQMLDTLIFDDEHRIIGMDGLLISVVRFEPETLTGYADDVRIRLNE